MLLRSVQQEEQQQADSVTSCVRALRRPPPRPEVERAINALDVPEAGLVRPGEALLDLLSGVNLNPATISLFSEMLKEVRRARDRQRSPWLLPFRALLRPTFLSLHAPHPPATCLPARRRPRC